jgi:heterodisulfide reductase subunit A
MTDKQGHILIVGAGIGGIRSALDLARGGCAVTLIDRADHIGGLVLKLDRQFPTDSCGMCRMLPMAQRAPWDHICLRKGVFHPGIELRPATEIVELSGEPGKFTVRLRQTPQWVDPNLCISCGACADVCPVTVGDGFNCGLSQRKAIYPPVPHAVSAPFVIDTAACTGCGACVTACPTGAVTLPQSRRQDFKILVVDDEFALRDSLKEWMVSEGYTTVHTAESGAQALEMLSQSTYDLMLTDIKMPGMDGVELLQQAKSIRPELTVVMMTAYATVETAVQAMQQGALDYLVKPFDPDKVMALIETLFRSHEATSDLSVTVGAVIVGTGADYFDPGQGKNPYAYGVSPCVMTQLQFERWLSGTGPSQGRLVRPGDGKPLRKIAWLQCVGSRDLDLGADFCSGICCMISIKEALWARQISAGQVETTVFHMDLRTAGKTHQAYRDQAENQGIRFERARVHSLLFEPESGDPVLRYVREDGVQGESTVDLVVLAAGQRPPAGLPALAEALNVELAESGFFKEHPFAPAASSRDGIFLSGSATGFKEISQSVIQASAAAVQAARLLHRGGADLKLAPGPAPAAATSPDSPLRIQVVVCTCQDKLCPIEGRDALIAALEQNPLVGDVTFIDQLCSPDGRQAAQQVVHGANGLLVAACQHERLAFEFLKMAKESGLPSALTEWVHLPPPHPTDTAAERYALACLPALRVGLARLAHADPDPLPVTPIAQKALVIGGGIAGMQAALTIADLGFGVDLIEAGDRLGGNLNWLHHTIDGEVVAPLLDRTNAAVAAHPRINVHLNARWQGASGHVGHFLTMVENPAGELTPIDHGAIILAVGGGEVSDAAYGLGSHASIITQKMFEKRLADNQLEPDRLSSVVMIQCAGSRQPPRNYCSRVCCAASLKHALYLKQNNPAVAVYILYRDIMTQGAAETYYTQARQAGVIFIPYTLDQKPEVMTAPDEPARVLAMDPILGCKLEITADMVVLAMGVSSALPAEMAAAYGAVLDNHGFFQEMDPKWRPVQGLAEGVFACGLCLGPQTIGEAMASGQAAAQGALHLLKQPSVRSGLPLARVRHGLCSLCRQCLAACPYGARWLDQDLGQIMVHSALCQGCGACAAACPNGAAVVSGYSETQMLSVIDAALS